MNTQTRFGLGALAAVLLAGAAIQPAVAAEYWLRADEVGRAVNAASGTASVRMWQYRRCASTFANASCVPLNGGVLRVPAGDTQLIIHLQNFLRSGAPATPISLPFVAAYEGFAVPTSIMIPGLPSPTFQAGATAAGFCPAGASAPVSVSGSAPVSVSGRVRSFTSEVANNTTAALAVGTYCWTGLKPGTYLYQSGTHPALQVQMGLYGALVVDGSCGTGTRCAYLGVAYDREVVAVFSEIDPQVHAKVANRTYGSEIANNPMTSTIFYEPQYFFVEGEASDGANAPVAYGSKAVVTAGTANQRILLRMVNAGIEAHAPLLNGERFTLVAEDASPYTASAAYDQHPQYSTLLAAGKTLDAILTPSAAGTYVLLDRRRGLANTGASSGADASGMLVNLVVAP